MKWITAAQLQSSSIAGASKPRLAEAYQSLIPVPQTQSTFHRHAQRTVFRHRDARLQSRSINGLSTMESRLCSSMDVYFEDGKVLRTESCLSSVMIMIVSAIRLRLARFGAPREG